MLWTRYLRDGIRLLTLTFSSVLPLAIWVLWLRLKDDYRDQNLTITGTQKIAILYHKHPRSGYKAARQSNRSRLQSCG